MKELEITDKIKEIIHEFTDSNRCERLFDLRLKNDFEEVIMYPTNDLWLTEEQLKKIKILMATLEEKEFFIAQFDGAGGLTSKHNKLVQADLNTQYEEYYNLNLYSTTMHFSSNATWAIFIEELLDYGVGIFVAKKSIIEKFKTIYSEYKNENKEYFKLFESDSEYAKQMLKWIKS